MCKSWLFSSFSSLVGTYRMKRGYCLVRLSFKVILFYFFLLFFVILIFLGLDAVGFSGVWLYILVLLVVGVIFMCNLYIRLLKPLDKLSDALDGVNFDNSLIDLSKLDNLDIVGYKELREILRMFSYFVDVIDERIRRVNQEMYMSEHDELTNCYNRVHLERVKLEYEMRGSFFIIFVDVNNLKKMNDKFGHEAGDDLIRRAAKALSNWNTYGDVYRMGGDEFMVVITDKPLDNCMDLYNRWYDSVGQLNRETDGFRCVLSCGVSYGLRGDSFDELQKRADEAMYEKKKELKTRFGEPLSRQ